MPPPPPTEGAQARARLLHAALRLFAENGFAKASIRDIAQAAGVNPASISYYSVSYTHLTLPTTPYV